MADKYKYTFNLPFDQEEIAPEPTGVMGKTAAPKPQEKSWDQQLADMLGAYWGSPEEAKKRTSPTPPADYTDEELSIYEKYADVSPPYAEGMIGGLRDMQAYRDRWGITTSLTDKPKWLTEQGSDVSVPEEPTIQTQELPDTDPETGQPILSGADVVAKEVARKMPQETADTGNGLMSSPRTKAQNNTVGTIPSPSVFVEEMESLEGLKGDTLLGSKVPTYSYGVTEQKAKEFGMKPSDYGTMKEFAEAFSAKYMQEKYDIYKDYFDNVDKENHVAIHSYLYNAGKLYDGQKKALKNNDMRGFIHELRDVVYAGGSSVTGLSKRRAAEANMIGKNLPNWTPIVEIVTTGTREKPVFNWVDAKGNIVETFQPKKPLHPKSKMEPLAVPQY